MLNLDELCAVLEIPEFESDADTLQGYLMEQLERLPVVGDEIVLGGWRLFVDVVEERAVKQVVVTQVSAEETLQDNRSGK